MSWGRGTRGGILEGVDPLEEAKEWDARFKLFGACGEHGVQCFVLGFVEDCVAPGAA